MPRQHERASSALSMWNDPSTQWERATFDGGKTWREFARTPSGGTIFRDDAGERQRLTQMLDDHRGFRRNFNLARAVGIGLPAAAAVVPALAGAAGASGAGAASSAGSAAGYSSPGLYGGVSFGAPSLAGGAGGAGAIGAGVGAPAAATAGRMIAGLSMGDLVRLGVGGVTSILGNRSQNRALDRQIGAERYGIDQQMQFAREQEEFRRAEAARVAEEDRRRWEAEQANRERETQLFLEDRARQQRLEDEDRGLRERARLTIGDLIRTGPQYRQYGPRG